MPRLHQIDSDRLRKLRIEGGWETPEDFANDAGVSKGVVVRAESHGRLFLTNVKKLAKALRLDDPRILLASKRVQDGLITIEIILKPKASIAEIKEQFDSGQLVGAIEQQVKPLHDIAGISIRFSSVFVRLLCHCDDATTFVYALRAGNLASSDVQGIRFFKADIHRSCRIFPVTPDTREFIDVSGNKMILTLQRQPGDKDGSYYAFPSEILSPSRVRRIGWFYSALRSAVTYEDILGDILKVRIAKRSVTLWLPKSNVRNAVTLAN